MRNRTWNKIRTFAVVLSALCTISLSVSGAEETEKKTIGKKQEDAYAVALTNATGKDIRALAISVDGGEYAPSLLEANDPFKDQEERILYTVPEEATGETIPVYDIRLTFTNNQVFTLHNFPFGNAQSVELHLEDAVAYVKYKNLTSGTEIDTLEEEKQFMAGTATITPAARPLDQSGSAQTQTTQEAPVTQTDSSSGSSGSSQTYEEDYGTDSSDYSYSYSYETDGSDYSYDYSYDDYGSSGSGSDSGGCLDDGIILN